MDTSPRRAGGRTLIDRNPGQLVWILSARESADREEQLANQLKDLREFVGRIGGRVDREVPENAVSSYRKTRVQLADGTDGYRVVRPDWESILTALRRRECNALAVADIDRATRDPRLLEDLIEVVEHYGAYVVSLSGNIDLTTDAGISAARGLVNQRNQESRNTSRRVSDGKRHAALDGKNHGGPNRPFGWRSDRIRINKREAAHIRREVPRILAGVSPLTIAQEWTDRGIPTATGLRQWRLSTVLGIFLNPRLCGLRTYRGEVLKDAEGDPVHGLWEPILTESEHHAVVSKWKPNEKPEPSRLGAKGTGYRTKYLLSPFIRCGKCNARMLGTVRYTPRKRIQVEIYRCPGKGLGGCGSICRAAAPINEYIKTLVTMEHQKIEFRKLEELPPWPKAGELAALQQRIEESTARYEAGEYSAERYYPSLARMEAREAILKREKRAYEARQQARKHAVIDLAKRWDDPDFTIEQKQAAIDKTLSAVIIMPSQKGARSFHPDLIKPIFHEDNDT
jgi:DNA invertase Pin-like site-specific DNA recombinase